MTMGALSWPSTNLIVLHHILRSPSPSSLLSLLIFKPFPNPLQRQTPPFSSAASFQYPFSHRRLTCSASKSNSNPNKVFLEHSNDVVLSDDYEKTENEEYEEFDAEKETASAGEGLERVLDVPVVSETEVKIKLPVPILTAKEKKELASFAHGLGKKLKSQQVGKCGVTESVTTALIESLEANELLKLKIHGTCPGELDDVVKQLEEGTGSVIVGQIGRTVILYRPSLTKLKAEEKKKQVGRVHVRTKSPYNTLLQMQNIGQGPRLSGRGRRGSSRV